MKELRGIQVPEPVNYAGILDLMSDELDQFCKANDLRPMSAEELAYTLYPEVGEDPDVPHPSGIARDKRVELVNWLANFVERWDNVEDCVRLTSIDRF